MLLALVPAVSGCTYLAVGGGIGALLLGQKSSSSNNVFSTPPPTVTAVSPTSGSHAGGTVVTITGTHFPSDATVAVGGITATNVTVGDSTTLTATVPRTDKVGAADVTVTDPHGGTGTLAGAFTYTAGVPAVTIGQIPSTVSHNVVFGITVSELESDTADLLVELDSGSGFQQIPSSQFVSGNLKSVPTSQSGVLTNVTWDSDVQFSTSNASNLRIRVTASNTITGKPGTPVVSNTFSIVNNTPPSVTVQQPAKAAFDTALVYNVTDVNGNGVSVTSLRWTNAKTGASGPLTVKSGQGVGPCSSSQSSPGARVSTVWDSLADIGYGNNQLVTITVSISNGVFQSSSTTLPFFVSNGPISDQSLFLTPKTFEAGVCAGDVTGDGRPDLVGCGPFQPFTQFGSNIAIAPNNGLSFDATLTLTPPGVPIHSTVSSIITDPTRAGHIFCNVFGVDVYESFDSGTNWFPTNQPSIDGVENCLAINPFVPFLVYSGGWFTGLWFNFNQTPNANGSVIQWFPPAPFGIQFGDARIATLVVDPDPTATLGGNPAPGSTIYAGTVTSGIWVTHDFGQTWNPTPTAFPGGFVSSIALDTRSQPATLMFVGTLTAGVWVSPDAGTTWFQGGPPEPFTRALAYDTSASPAVLYAATNVGVWSTTDFANWTPSFASGGPGSVVYALALKPPPSGSPAGTPSTLYAGVKGGGVSTFSGGSWNTPTNQGLTDLEVTSLALEVSSGNVFAGTRNKGVFLSTDGAATWTSVNGTGANSITLLPQPQWTRNGSFSHQFQTEPALGECTILDIDGDGRGDLVAADDFQSPGQPNGTYTQGSLLQKVLAGQPDPILFDYPDDFQNVQARTQLLFAPQKNGTIDMTSATWQPSSAPICKVDAQGNLILNGGQPIPNVAPLKRLAFQNPAVWPQLTPTPGVAPFPIGFVTTDNVGWFVQQLISADTDAPPTSCTITQASGTATVTEVNHGRSTNDNVVITGSADFNTATPVTITVVDADHYTFATAATATGPENAFVSLNGGAKDLVVVHGIRQAGYWVENPADTQGCIVVRQTDPQTKLLGPAFFLDPSDMGKIPTCAAVADIESVSRTTALVNPTARVGSPDVVVLNSLDDSLTFYLQYAPAVYNTGASYTPPTYVSLNLPLSAIPQPSGSNVTFPAGDAVGLSVGDVDGDGANDFIVTTQTSNVVIVFLYDPNPSDPQSLVTLTNGLLPFRVASILPLPASKCGRPTIADLNGSGQGTIVVPSFLTNDDILFIPTSPRTVAPTPPGSVTPTFVSKRFTCDYFPNVTLSADFNGDGRADIATINPGGSIWSVYDQTAPGTLDRNAIPVATGLQPLFLAVGDVTGTGRQSLICSNYGDSTLQVFGPDSTFGLKQIAQYDMTNVSNLSFTNPVKPSLPSFIAVGDTTGTGRNDIVVGMELMSEASGTTPGGLAVIRGSPLTSSIAMVQTGSFSVEYGVAVGDLNGDGLPDLVVAEAPNAPGGSGGVTVFLLQNNGSYVATRPLPNGGFAPGVEMNPPSRFGVDPKIVDLDGDGNPDLLDGNVIFWGPWTDGPFGPKTVPPSGTPMPGLPSNPAFGFVYTAIADFNNDGRLDLAGTSSVLNQAAVFYQTSPRVFQTVELPSGHDPQQCVAGDLNGDGLPDFATLWSSDNLMVIYYQQPNGAGLGGPVTFQTGAFPEGIAIMDIDGDGKNDVVAANRGGNALQIFFQR